MVKFSTVQRKCLLPVRVRFKDYYYTLYPSILLASENLGARAGHNPRSYDCVVKLKVVN
jgi:hypothetical protein